MAKLIMYWFCYLVFVMMVYGMERRVMSVLKVHDSSQFKLYDKKQIQAETGQNITLSGWFNSSAVPEYRFNGEPIKESKNIRITWYQNNRILTILKLEDTHTGFYELYHPSLKTSDQIYLYVKSENIFVPSISYKLFCYEPICIVPCRLTNYADESGVVKLFLDGRKQTRTYDPRVGYKIPQSQLENNMANAACHKGYRKVHYTIEFQDKLPNDWKLTIVNTNPWPNLNDTVHLKCSLSYNTSYAASVFASEIVLLHEREGDSDPKTICLIDSSDEARVNNHNNIITTEKEFKILKYTPDCRGKLICKVMNMTSNRSFNRHSSIYLDQLQITSRTDAIVEAIVGQKEKIAAELRAPSEERQYIDIKWSRLSEKLFCQESACLISNETKVLQLITTDNTTISIFQDIEEDKPGWHRYSAQSNKKGSNESIQEVFWDIYVRAPVELRTNCSSLLFKSTVCKFTLISSVPDKSKMFISRLGKTDEISSNETEIISGEFHYLMIYLVNITRTTSIEGRSSTDNPRIQKIYCVEFSFSVDPSFDNSNAQDIYEGDNVTVKGGIAESNESFRINGSSLFSSLTREYTEIILTNVSSSFDRIFRLFNSTEHILATIQIPAPKKIVAPHNSTTETIYYSESVTQLICPTEGSPIVYNWTKNGIPIKEHTTRHLFLDILDPLGDFECCGINRVGTECSIINLKLTYALLSAKTASIAVSIVITIILLFVVSWLIYMYMNETKVILLAGAQGAGKTTILNMFLNCMKVKNVWDLNKSNIEFASRFDYKAFGIDEHKDLMKKPDLLFGEPAEEYEDYQSATRDPRCIKPLRYNGQLYAMADIPGFSYNKEDRMTQNWTQLLSNFWHCKLRNVHCIGVVIRRDKMWHLHSYKQGVKYLLSILPKRSAAIKVILTRSNYEDLKESESLVFKTLLKEKESLLKREYVKMNNNMLRFLVVRGIELHEDYVNVRAKCVKKREWIIFFDIQKGKEEIAKEIEASDTERKLFMVEYNKRLNDANILFDSISNSFDRSRDAFLELLEDVKSYEPISIRTLWMAHMNNQADELIRKLVIALIVLCVENSRMLVKESLVILLMDYIFELEWQETTFLPSNLRKKNALQLFEIADRAFFYLHPSTLISLIELFQGLARTLWTWPDSKPSEETLLGYLKKLKLLIWKLQHSEQLTKILFILSSLAKSNDSNSSFSRLCEYIEGFRYNFTELNQIIVTTEDTFSVIRRLLEPDLFADIIELSSNIPSSLREAKEAYGSEKNLNLSPYMRTLLNLIFTRVFFGDKAKIAKVLQSLRLEKENYQTSSNEIALQDRLTRIENTIRLIEDSIVEPSRATISDSSEPSYLPVSRRNISSARYNVSEETVLLKIPEEQKQPQTEISDSSESSSLLASDERTTFPSNSVTEDNVLLKIPEEQKQPQTRIPDSVESSSLLNIFAPSKVLQYSDEIRQRIEKRSKQEQNFRSKEFAFSAESCEVKLSASSRQHLANLNREVVVTPGDGACLFHAASYNLQEQGIEISASALREQIVNYLTANEERFVRDHFMEPNHLNEMTAKNAWGTIIELHAVSEIYNVNILVVGNEDNYTQMVGTACDDAYIVLHYSGTHYSATRNRRTNDSEPNDSTHENIPDSSETLSLFAYDERTTHSSDSITEDNVRLNKPGEQEQPQTRITSESSSFLASNQRTTFPSEKVTEENVRLNKQKHPPSENAAPSEQSYLLVSLILRFLRGVPEFFRTLYRWCWIEPLQERKDKHMQSKTKKKLEMLIEKLKEFPELSYYSEEMQMLAVQVMEPKKP